jgi:hypothetical protein
MKIGTINRCKYWQASFLWSPTPNKYVVLILERPSIQYNTAGVALVLTRKSNRMGLKKRRATLLERQAFGKALLA